MFFLIIISLNYELERRKNEETVVMHKASNDQIEHPFIFSLAFTWWQWQLRVANKLLTLQVCSNFYLSKLLVSCEPSKKSKS